MDPFPRFDLDVQVDETLLGNQVFAERMGQYMRRLRLAALGGPPAALYMVWKLSHVLDPRWLAIWCSLIVAGDVATIVSASLYLRRSRPRATQERWLHRQVWVQTLLGIAWGSTALQVALANATAMEPGVLLVLNTVNGIAAITLLPFRKAVLGFTLGISLFPVITFIAWPSVTHTEHLVGFALLLVVLNLYVWNASNQFVGGIQGHLRAEQLAVALRDAAVHIHDLATRDELTGAFNRRQALRMLEEWRGALFQGVERRREPERGALSLLLLDVDHFKRINDTRGHLVGDEVLRSVSSRIASQLRGCDVLSRVGGEEFLVLLPGTPADSALIVAERLRNAVAGAPVAVEDEPVPVTISIGVVDLDAAVETGHQALNRADQALYRAKNGGRNRVERGTPPLELSTRSI